MARLLNLAGIQALAAATPYGGERSLTSESAALLISAASLLYDYNIWQGASYTLTDAEKDDIAAMLAQAVDDLLEEGDTPVSDFVNLAEVVYVADTTVIELTDIEASDYNRIEIYASGLLSDYDGTWVDGLLVNINEDATANNYWSYNRRWYGSAAVSYHHLQSVAGWLIKYGLMADTPSDDFFSNLKMTIYNPNRSELAHMEYSAMSGHVTSDKLQNFIGSGIANVTSDFDAIRLKPENGDKFLIDPASGTEPDEARLTVYGLK